MSKLLILACSARKNSSPGRRTALERYDGPAFRVLRRYQQLDPSNVNAFVLSAEYGLVSAAAVIPPYDRRMSHERATMLKRSVTRGVSEIVNTDPPGSVCICAGRTYIEALDDALPLLRETAVVTILNGAPGGVSGRLHDWLHEHPPTVMPSPAGALTIGGKLFTLDRDELLARARQAMKAKPKEAAQFHTWFVDLDGARVAPKWLISVSSGVPVSAFATDAARRILARVGIEVHRA